MGIIRKRRSSLSSLKLTAGLTEKKDETSDRKMKAISGQKKDGNMNFCFSLISMMIQQMRAREMNPWLRLMDTIENRR